MVNELKKAKVKTTGKIIEVYRLLKGAWCDYADCNTVYNDEDLIILEE